MLWCDLVNSEYFLYSCIAYVSSEVFQPLNFLQMFVWFVMIFTQIIFIEVYGQKIIVKL